jgi:hypothetical protein
MTQACFQSARIAGRCSACKTLAKFVHCPKQLKGIFCEVCCPQCAPPKKTIAKEQLVNA